MPTTPNTEFPVMGGLYGWDYLNMSPQPILQPGGVGTPVTQPVQTIGEHNGQYVFGCGHSVNHAEYFQYADAQGTRWSGVRCPLCFYVVQTEIPPEDHPPYFIG